MAARRRITSAEPSEPSIHELTFRRCWAMCGLKIEPREQFYFDMGRMWRFDFAWPAYRVAVELHGGEWSGGRHSRGGGVDSDSEKSNAAQLKGWMVLTYTGSRLKANPVGVIEQVIQALRMRGAK